MVEYFRPVEADYPELVEEANQIFAGKVGEDGTFTYNNRFFQDLLPKLYGDGRTMKDHYAVRQDGKIVAHVGAFPDSMNVCGHILKIRGIGTVGVDRNCRRSGYMVKLMNWAMDDMRKDGIDFSALGGLRQRYEYWNFTVGGINSEFTFIPSNADKIFGQNSNFGYSFVLVENPDDPILESIAELNTKQPVHCLRPKEDLYWILKSWNASTYQIQQNGDFCGYAVCDRKCEGISELLLYDGHEIGKVLNDWVRWTKCDVRLATFPWQAERIQWLADHAEHGNITKVDNFCILRFQRVLQAFFDLKSTYSKLLDGEMTVAIDNGETLKITVKDNKATVEAFEGEAQFSLPQMRATRLFFSHLAYVATNDLDLPVCAQNWFPLPLSLPSADLV